MGRVCERPTRRSVSGRDRHDAFAGLGDVVPAGDAHEVGFELTQIRRHDLGLPADHELEILPRALELEPRASGDITFQLACAVAVRGEMRPQHLHKFRRHVAGKPQLAIGDRRDQQWQVTFDRAAQQQQGAGIQAHNAV